MVAARSDKKNSRSLRYVVYGSICGFCLLINSHKGLAGREREEGGSLVPVVVVVVQKKKKEEKRAAERAHTHTQTAAADLTEQGRSLFKSLTPSRFGGGGAAVGGGSE